MKRLAAIWIGAIVVLLCIGLIAGKITKKKEEEKEPPSQEVVVGYDDEGNPIKDKIPLDEITINIDGEEYQYNACAITERPFKFEGVELNFQSSVKDLYDGNCTEKNGIFTLNDSSVKVTYNPSTTKIIRMEAYTPEYTKMTNINNPYCENFELPLGIKLGKSTLKDVQNAYGVSVEYQLTEGGINTKYYTSKSKTNGFMILTFTPDNILCAVNIGFDFIE